MNFRKPTFNFLIYGFLGLFHLMLLTAGCGKSAPNTVDNATAQRGFDEGKALMDQSEWEAALAEFDTALAGGVIGPDQVGELYLQKALALAHLGRFEESADELAKAEQGADPDQIAEFKSEIEALQTSQ